MPTKKKASKKRRRIGTPKTGTVQTLGGVAVGALAARFIGTKFLTKMDPKIVAGIQAAAGVFLSMQKNPLVKAVGVGMFGSGVISAGQSFGIIGNIASKSSYLQKYPSDEFPVISGPGNSLNYLGNPQGSPELSVISGIGNPQGDMQAPVIAGESCLVS